MKYLGFGLIILATIFFALFVYGDAPSLGSSLTSGKTFSTASSTSWTIGPDEALTVLPAKSNRGYVLFSNHSDTDHFVCLASSCAIDTGILIAASSTYALSPMDGNLYTGDVTASAYSSTTLIIHELRF